MQSLKHDEGHKHRSIWRRFEALFSQFTADKLPYIAYLVAVLSYSVVYVYQESTEENPEGRNRDLGEGWQYIWRRKDIADFEWTFWVSQIRGDIVFALFNHIFIGILTRWFFPEAHKLAETAFCLFCVYMILGYQYIVTVTSLCFSIVAVVKFSRSKTVGWVVLVSTLVVFHYGAFNMQFLETLMSKASPYSVMGYTALTFSILRTGSYCFETLQDDDDVITIMYDIITYNFYLPYFFFGPVMTFDAFKQQENTNHQQQDYVHVAKEVVTTILCVYFIDCLLHFLYVSSLPADIEFTNQSPGVVLTFLMFCDVMLDWVKAWTLYSLSSGIASHVDGYSGAPHGPKCMANLYTFADTAFDRGIHHWVCRYIYDPVGKDHQNVTLEALAAALTFAFVTVWQGGGKTVYIWAVLNSFGLINELFWQQLAVRKGIIDKHTSIICGSINYLMILFFNCIAIIGLTPTKAFAENILMNDTFGCFMSMIAVFCYVSILYKNKDTSSNQNTEGNET